MGGLGFRYKVFLSVVLALFAAPASAAERSCTASVDLLRDHYAIPHVFADSVRGAYYAAGWAEAEDQAVTFANLILRGEGRRAEFFGSGNVDDDIRARAFGLLRSAEEDWLLLSPRVRVALTAFAEGYNAYIVLHPELPSYVQPVTGPKVAAAMMRDAVDRGYAHLDDRESSPGTGSNMAAVAPERTSAGFPLIYGDPHLGWSGAQREVHLHAGDLQVHGWAFIGPFFGMGRGGGVAFSRTSNNPDTGDVWEEILAGGDRLSCWDWEAGAFVPMERRKETILVAGEDPHLETLYYTRHGWVFRNDPADGDLAYAMRLAAAGRVQFVEEVMRQAWSDDWSEYLDVIGEPDAAKWNLVVADDTGHIAYGWGGRVAIRPDDALDYNVPLPGDTPETEWPGGVWRFDAEPMLPLVVDPIAGWVQNSNGPPWWATGEGEIPGAEHWPRYVVNLGWDAPSPRGVRLRELLEANDSWDEDDLRQMAFDTLCANARDFVEAVERGWAAHGAALTGTPAALELDAILRAWDARAEIDREGMSVMFHHQRISTLGWAIPGQTPSQWQMQTYLDQLDQVAANMLDLYGTLHVPWGDMHVVARGGEVFPAPGGTSGIPAPLMAHQGTVDGRDVMDPDGVVRSNAGSHYVHGHQMNPAYPRSWATTAQGQIDEALYPDSPHLTDQTSLYVQKQWREMLFDRTSVEGNLCPYGDPGSPSYDPDHEHPASTTLEVALPCGLVPVSDGNLVPGTPLGVGKTSDGMMRVVWDADTCASAAHHLLFGDLDDVASYGYSGEICGLVQDGEADLPMPDTVSGAAFFVIVGEDGAGVESHHGYRHDGTIRPAPGMGRCGITGQDAGAVCALPPSGS